MARIFRNERVVIQAGFYIIISLALLVISFRWVASWFVAIFIHELCHYIALCLCRVPVFQITVGAFGADIQTGAMTNGQEIFSSLAGPLGSILLLFFVRVFPYVSLCALGQLVFNLMPIYPMDGGRVVTGVCIRLFGERRGVQISKVISCFFVIFLFCVSLLITFYYNLGVVPVLLTAIIIVRALKIPCKGRQLIVQ